MQIEISDNCTVWAEEFWLSRCPFPIKMKIIHETETEYEEFEHEFDCDTALLLAEALENAVEEYRCAQK